MRAKTGATNMQEMTLTEMNEVSGAGTRLGTLGSGDSGLQAAGGRAGGVIGNFAPTPLGGVRVGTDGANN
jgi:hypothetical protein